MICRRSSLHRLNGEAVGRLILSYDGEEVGSVDLIANPVEPGFSLGSWLVGIFEGVLVRF